MLFHSDGLDLEGMEGQIDLTVFDWDLRLVVFQDVRQSDGLRRGAESYGRFRVGALRFEQADDYALPVLGGLYGFRNDARSGRTDERILLGESAVFFVRGNGVKRLVESVGFLQDLGILGAALVGEESVGESVQAAVAVGVGIVGAF